MSPCNDALLIRVCGIHHLQDSFNNRKMVDFFIAITPPVLPPPRNLNSTYDRMISSKDAVLKIVVAICGLSLAC